MKVCDVYKDKKQLNSMIILESNNEGRILIDALTFYVENNKRKQKAKRLLKQLESDLSCY